MGLFFKDESHKIMWNMGQNLKALQRHENGGSDLLRRSTVVLISEQREQLKNLGINNEDIQSYFRRRGKKEDIYFDAYLEEWDEHHEMLLQAREQAKS